MRARWKITRGLFAFWLLAMGNPDPAAIAAGMRKVLGQHTDSPQEIDEILRQSHDQLIAAGEKIHTYTHTCGFSWQMRDAMVQSFGPPTNCPKCGDDLHIAPENVRLFA